MSLLLSNGQWKNCLWNDAFQEYCKSVEAGEAEGEQDQICGNTNETLRPLSNAWTSSFVMG